MGSKRMIRIYLKVILIGDGGVGKTTIVKRYIMRTFSSEYIPTIGVNVYDYKNKITINSAVFHASWSIWDLAGQPTFRDVVERYFDKARGVLLVFDITRRDTFESIPTWFNTALPHVHKAAAFILVGNKIDLRNRCPDCVRKEEGEYLAKNLSKAINFEIPYIETSAKEGINIELIFKEVLKLHLKRLGLLKKLLHHP